MSTPQMHSSMAETQAAQTRMALVIAGIGVGCLVAAGAILWWREGDKLFSDGLITALMRCF
jgi:hypothetical protein